MKKPKQPSFVVLDSNVFISDYWLRSPSFLLLRDFVNKTKSILVVPRIVLEEVINHHSEDLDKLKSEARAHVREAARLVRNITRGATWLVDLNRAASVEAYEKFLTSELAKLGAQIPEYAGIPHNDIVKRDLRRRRPFQQSGKGYRDALLWETIIRECVVDDGVTVFVTQNLRDFGGPDSELHNDLLAEVRSISVGGWQVLLCKDLLAFTDTYIVPYLVHRKDFALLVQHNKVKGLDLIDVCGQHMDSIVAAVNDAPVVLVDDVRYEPQVDAVNLHVAAFQVEQASEVSQHQLLVRFQFSKFVSFTYFLPRSDYFSLPEEQASSIVILDEAWNESVMHVESSTILKFMCRLTFNNEKEDTESFEVEEVERGI